MNVLESIYSRKSIRKFKDEKVPKEDILKMLSAAAQAPSPKHQQNWNFVVLTNREIINKMAEIVTESHEKIGDLAKTEKEKKIHMSVLKYYTCFKNAPVVIMVYGSEYKMIEYKILKENNVSQDILDML
ncbi:MAG: nitroreductase family protein, partial [Clostridium butyricum]